MKFKLICTNSIKKIILELLSARGIAIDDDADVTLIEKGLPLPEGKICIIFECVTLDMLIDFIDQYAKKAGNPNNVIAGKTYDGYELISYSNIIYFESNDNNTFCKAYSGQYRVKEKLYELEKYLCNDGFVRIAKCYIVNIMNVTEIIPWFGGRLLLRFKDSKEEIEVAKSYAKNFKDYLRL